MQCDCTRRRPSLRLPSSAWTPAAGAACWCARVTPAPTHPVPSHRLSGRRACAKVQLLSNRARAYLELCMPLAAMEDAQQCLQLDPSFVKAYHRLAAAHTALGRCGAYPTHTPPLEHPLPAAATRLANCLWGPSSSPSRAATAWRAFCLATHCAPRASVALSLCRARAGMRRPTPHPTPTPTPTPNPTPTPTPTQV